MVDDFGEFIPTITFETPGTSSFTPNATGKNYATWTKTGRMVHLSGWINGTLVKGTASGFAKIPIPFQVRKPATEYGFTGVVGAQSGRINYLSGQIGLSCWAVGGKSEVKLYMQRDSAGAQAVTADNFSAQDLVFVNFSVSFEVEGPLLHPNIQVPIDFSAVKKLPRTDTTIFPVEQNSEYNHHPFLTSFNGIKFAMHSTAENDEGQEGTRVTWHTNDGAGWVSRGFLSPHPGAGFRYYACGFWIRDGVLLALASRDEAGPPYGQSFALHAFPFDPVTATWGAPFEVHPDGGCNYPPTKVGDDWFMSIVESDRSHKFVKGDIGSWADVAIPVPAGTSRVVEPSWHTASDGRLVAHFRNLDTDGLWRSISNDRGSTWPTPELSGFPDVESKHLCRRLSNGKYIMVSNPNTPAAPVRIPLAISVSDDGYVFDRVYILRDEATSPAFPAGINKVSGYSYPDILENEDGTLDIIYSRNKEDIIVSTVSVGDLI